MEDISTGDRGLLEVKCFYSATQKGIKERKCAYTPQEAAVLLKDCHIKKSTTGHLMLGKNEGHHFQAQGAMQIAKAGWCEYVAWTPAGIFIERIRKDDNFWTEKMLPNLKWFFYNCLLPELASPRHLKGASIREPEGVVIKKKERLDGLILF